MPYTAAEMTSVLLPRVLQTGGGESCHKQRQHAARRQPLSGQLPKTPLTAHLQYAVHSSKYILVSQSMVLQKH
jgi:hypothetical protein